MLKAAVISVLPDIFEALRFGVVGRAVERELLALHIIALRDFADEPHRQVDDRPYGGGPGMVMMYEPLAKAIEHAKVLLGEEAKVVYLSPQGRTLHQAMIAENLLPEAKPLILLCGRYEGIDERVLMQFVDEEWSVGDLVLSGGEFAALIALDAMIRLIPGALGHSASAVQDSFSDGLLDYPHYTRPEQINGISVPAVLLGGNHEAIARWRRKMALGNTLRKRPDLLKALALSKNDEQLLAEFKKECNNA